MFSSIILLSPKSSSTETSSADKSTLSSTGLLKSTLSSRETVSTDKSSVVSNTSVPISTSSTALTALIEIMDIKTKTKIKYLDLIIITFIYFSKFFREKILILKIRIKISIKI